MGAYAHEIAARLRRRRFASNNTSDVLGARNVLNKLLRSGALTVADYRADLGVTGTLTATAVANQIGAAPALAEVGGSGPIYLPFVGQKYAYMPGVALNFFYTPDSAAANVLGDIDVRVLVALNDWTPSAFNTIFSKLTDAGAQRSWLLWVNAGGTLRLYWDNASNVQRVVDSSVAPTVADGEKLWLRWTRVKATGVFTFYTAVDSDGTPGTWDQLGTTTTWDAGEDTFLSTANVEVGSYGSGGGAQGTQKTYRAQIYNGINGTLAVDFNAADWSETTTNGATQVSSTTGETWTLNNTGATPAQIVGSASLLFNGTSQYLQMATTLIQPEVIYLVTKQITWTSARFLFDGKTSSSGYIAQYPAPSPKISLSEGISNITNSTATVGQYEIYTGVIDGASSSLRVGNGTAATGSLSGAVDMSGFTLSANATPTGTFSNQQVKEVIIGTVAGSAARQAQIRALLSRIYGI